MTPQSEQVPLSSNSTQVGDSPERMRRRKLGFAISIVGIVALVPMMLCAIFIDESRGLYALLALVAWIIWKIGRTTMKLNSPAELR